MLRIAMPMSAIHGERLMNAMPEERPRSRKTELALAIANGTSVTAWARGNQVPKRTAYRWAGEPEVRSAGSSGEWRVESGEWGLGAVD